MLYFFSLGKIPALSLAELNAVLGIKNGSLVAPELFVLEAAGELETEKLIRRLGGTIKIGKIWTTLKIGQSDSANLIIEKVSNFLAEKASLGTGKFNFGFSDYSSSPFLKPAWGLEIKKRLTNKNISSRLVVSRDNILSSVVVGQNKLLRRGVELIFVKQGQELFIGETLAIQPFKELGKRDYGRPARDDLSGMLPPKLAQIMINLAQLKDQQELLLDPFCGSGTILSEALIMGYKNLFGSDISPKAAQDTRTNLSWTRELYDIKDYAIKVVAKNVLDLSKFIKVKSAGAIVCEPYLGPQRGLNNLPLVIKELEELYSAAIQEFFAVLKTGGRAVMIWPVFYGEKFLNPNYQGFKLVDPLSGFDTKGLSLTKRGTIIYHRSGQKVHREIIVLEKI